jgi:hypothetical protein
MTACIYGSDKCRLNPEPTDVQRAIWRRHKAKGTTPGNPKWYKVPKLPARLEFKYGQKPKYPALPTGAEYRIKHGDTIRPKEKDPFILAANKTSMADYVAAYDKAQGFKPAH